MAPYSESGGELDAPFTAVSQVSQVISPIAYEDDEKPSDISTADTAAIGSERTFMRNPLRLPLNGHPMALHGFDHWSMDYRPFPHPRCHGPDRFSRRAAPPGIE